MHEAKDAAADRRHDTDLMLLCRYRRRHCRADRDELLRRHSWIASYGARRFSGRGEPYDDLFQVAQLGLVKAVERFDPERGRAFAGFAVPTVLGELRRYFRDAAWTIHVGRSSKDLSVRLRRTVDDLTQELCRVPTPTEVAARMGSTVDEVLVGMDALEANRMRSLDAVETGDREGGSGAREWADDLADRATVRDAIRELPPRDRVLVQLRFYDGLTQEEIACRVGTSQVQISRRLRRICQRLRPALVELQ